jgi:hypothetical protein
LGLAVLIFTWGLQSKLSLYAGPHSAIRHMVQAKLLANDEQAYLPDHSEAIGPSTSAPRTASILGTLLLPLLALSILLESSKQSQELRGPQRPLRATSQASFSASFCRPPPSLL